MAIDEGEWDFAKEPGNYPAIMNTRHTVIQQPYYYPLHFVQTDFENRLSPVHRAQFTNSSVCPSNKFPIWVITIQQKFLSVLVSCKLLLSLADLWL